MRDVTTKNCVDHIPCEETRTRHKEVMKQHCSRAERLHKLTREDAWQANNNGCCMRKRRRPTLQQSQNKNNTTVKQIPGQLALTLVRWARNTRTRIMGENKSTLGE